MALNITPVTNHREREKGCIVYPVYSRRSKGLSIGINLYPDKKNCLFNCPYCEVFPFSSSAVFSLEQMEEDLKNTVDSAHKQNIEIKDICFSGNGEPTLSADFPDAFRLAEKIRAEAASASQLVVITNGTGLLQPQIFSLLNEAAKSDNMNIWLKLDAATPDWYQKMNRSSILFEKLIEKIKEFASNTSVTIQTMLCAINGEQQPEEEVWAWESFICELATKGNIKKVQLYGKARSAPEDPLASELQESYLENRCASLRLIFKKNEITTPVEVYL